MLTKLAEGVWVVSPEAKPRYPYANCMYIDDKIKTVIDLGAGGKAFADLPCPEVKLVLISHFHFDHVHGSSFFSNAALHAGWQEDRTYNDQDSYVQFHGYNLWDEIMPGIKRELYGEVVPIPDDVPVQPGFRVIPLNGTFQDMEKIDLGQRQLTAVHLPGHTVGHYGFYLEEEGILFSGDMDLVPTGPWYSSNSADVGDLIYSARRIKEINPRIVVPSHRHVQTKNIQASLQVYIQVVLDREAKIFDLLHEPQTLAQLSSHGLVFLGNQNQYQQFWERMTIRNHLKHLVKEGLIIELEPGVYQQV